MGYRRFRRFNEYYSNDTGLTGKAAILNKIEADNPKIAEIKARCKEIMEEIAQLNKVSEAADNNRYSDFSKVVYDAQDELTEWIHDNGYQVRSSVVDSNFHHVKFYLGKYDYIHITLGDRYSWREEFPKYEPLVEMRVDKTSLKDAYKNLQTIGFITDNYHTIVEKMITAADKLAQKREAYANGNDKVDNDARTTKIVALKAELEVKSKLYAEHIMETLMQQLSARQLKPYSGLFPKQDKEPEHEYYRIVKGNKYDARKQATNFKRVPMKNKFMFVGENNDVFNVKLENINDYSIVIQKGYSTAVFTIMDLEHIAQKQTIKC